MTTFPTPWLKITSGEISVNQQEHVGNLAVIELLRRVSGRAAAPAVLRAPDAPNYVFRENRLPNMRKMQVGCKIDGNLANDAET